MVLKSEMDQGVHNRSQQLPLILGSSRTREDRCWRTAWLGREEGEDWQDLGDCSPLSHPWGWSCAEYSSAYLWGTLCHTASSRSPPRPAWVGTLGFVCLRAGAPGCLCYGAGSQQEVSPRVRGGHVVGPRAGSE